MNHNNNSNWSRNAWHLQIPKSWEKDYPWVSSVRTDLQSAHCGICLKSFKINPHKMLKSYCVSSIVLSCLNSHFNCRFLSKLSHSISRWIIIIIQIDQEMPGTCKYQSLGRRTTLGYLLWEQIFNQLIVGSVSSPLKSTTVALAS